MRALLHTLNRHYEDIGARATEAALDQALPKLLKALPRVPNDDGLGGAGGCRGFGDRIKRMELSALSRSPLQGARALCHMVEELAELWPRFQDDTSCR